MVGAPAYGRAADLTAAMATHYRLDGLIEHLPTDWRPRSIVVVPAHRDPLQATLMKACGWLSPLEASLSRPLPRRTVQVVSIWPGETQTTEAEIAFLQAVAARAGWRVKIASGPQNVAGFKAYYEDPEADVLWVIGHGEQSPFRLEESGLVLSDGQLLTTSELAAFERPNAARRLLVLNICSATATQNRGGLARIGFAQGLTTADQEVVGHLWPIDYYAALAFGCALSASLVDHGPAEALSATISLMQRPRNLIDALAAIAPEQEAIARLSSDRAAEQVENILSWGSAVLLT
jgi:hypothetical protein